MLVTPDAPLSDTVEAVRPITVRHLLTMTCGWGAVLTETPLQKEMFARDVYSGAMGHALSADEFVARVCSLPLAFQPGEGWLYDTGMALLGVLLTRATGSSLTDAPGRARLRARWGCADTAFHGDPSRLATAYKASGEGLAVARRRQTGGTPARPPSRSSTAASSPPCADVFRFFCALADGELLLYASRAELVADALTPALREEGFPIIDPGGSWGLGTGLYPGGAWGWEGGTGTTAHVDPAHDAVGVLLTQRMMRDPTDAYPEFWEAVASS